MKNQFEKWEKIRAKGMMSYILKYGLLGWGLTTGLLFAIVTTFLIQPFFLEEDKPTFLSLLLPSLFVFSIGGIAWGWIMWIHTDWTYLKAKTSEQDDSNKKHRRN